MHTRNGARTLVVSLLGLFLVEGCYSTPESFIRRVSRLDCVRMRECEPEAFELQFDDEMDECRDQSKDLLTQIFEDAEATGCEYNADGGRDCVHTAYENRKDCSDGAAQDIGRDCADVLDCPGAPLVPEDPDGPASIGDSLMASFPPGMDPPEE